jgi:hypothetical protein
MPDTFYFQDYLIIILSIMKKLPIYILLILDFW